MRLYGLLAVTAVAAFAPINASFASHTAGHAKVAAKKMVAAPMYECAHCNIQMTAKEAKAHGMKCACGAKLTMVKKPVKTMMKAKKA